MDRLVDEDLICSANAFSSSPLVGSPEPTSAATENRAIVYVINGDPVTSSHLLMTIRSHDVDCITFDRTDQFLRAYDPTALGCVVAEYASARQGSSLLEALREDVIDAPAIITSQCGSVRMAVEAMQAGAVTFLEHPIDEGVLWDNIDRALARCERTRRRRMWVTSIRSKFSRLTENERMVWRGMIEGKQNKQIAADLDIGLRTVELRRSRILKKMGASSLAQLVRLSVPLEEPRESA